MSLLQKIKAAIPFGPLSFRSSSFGGRLIFAHQSNPPIPVDEHIALTYSSVWRAVRAIAGVISCLPIRIHERRNGRLIRIAHPVGDLLRISPDGVMTGDIFVETILQHAILWGNGYAEIVRNSAGEVIALRLIHPAMIEPELQDDGRLIYKIQQGSDSDVKALKAENVFHVMGMGFDGVKGYSLIRHAAMTVSSGLAAEKFGASFFANSARPGGIIETSVKLDDQALRTAKQQFDDVFAGASKAGKNVVLPYGFKWTQMTIPPDEAQYLQSRRFTVEEIGRWFGVPLPIMGDLSKGTYNNVEQMSIVYVQQALMPWIKRFSTQANLKLLGGMERTAQGGRVFLNIDTNGLMRGDSKTRAEFYRLMSRIGVLSINEIRELEEMNPVDTGDIRVIERSMAPLEEFSRGSNARSSSRLVAELQPAQNALRPVAVSIAERLLKRRYKAWNGKKGPTTEWLRDYDLRSREAVRAECRPLVQAVATIIGDGFGYDIDTYNVYSSWITEDVKRDLDAASELADRLLSAITEGIRNAAMEWDA